MNPNNNNNQGLHRVPPLPMIIIEPPTDPSGFRTDDNSSEADVEQIVYTQIQCHKTDLLHQFLYDGTLDVNHCFSENAPEDAVDKSLLQFAVEVNAEEVVRMLLFHRRKHLCDQKAQMAFLYAMRRNMTPIIRLFLQAVVENRFYIPLDDAFRHAMYKGQYDLVGEIIKKHRFNVNQESTWGLDKPLHIVAYHNQSQLIELLLENGAIVDALDRRGVTPLIVACSIAAQQNIAILLKHGSDPNYKACRDLYHFSSALRTLYRFSSKFDCSLTQKIIELLLQAGLDMKREQWIQSGLPGPFILASTHELLKYLSKCPQSLKTMCFYSIRQQLSSRTFGASILRSIDSLPVGPVMKKHLKMEKM